MRKKSLHQGFSLIEVLIFITILSLIFIAAAAVGTVSIRNSQNSANKLVATHYAEEAIEWLRSQKNADWVIFTEYGNPPPKIYCFYTEPISTWPLTTGNCTNDQVIDSLFRREVTVAYDIVLEMVNIDVNVMWSEGGNNYSVPISTVFTSLE